MSENFKFLEVKFSIYLNRRVFVMAYYIYVLNREKNFKYAHCTFRIRIN